MKEDQGVLLRFFQFYYDVNARPKELANYRSQLDLKSHFKLNKVQLTWAYF